MKNYYVYKHTSPNGKVYIGQTCQLPNKRFGKNGDGYKGSVLFYNAIQKYGWDNFKHEIIFEGLTKEDADRKEIELISKYKSNQKEFGYNLQSGGNNYSQSEDTKMKISKSKIGQKDSYETRIKKSDGHKGKKLSESAKMKLVENWECRDKEPFVNRAKNLGLSNKGRKHSEETRKKLSESHKGKCSKKVLCVETGIVYKSISEAANANSLWRQNIGKCCNMELETTGGYHWMFV